MVKTLSLHWTSTAGRKRWLFLDRFTEEKPFVKVGMELFLRRGSRHRPGDPPPGPPHLLDLKLHDIPNTVRKAMAALSALDVDHQPPRRRYRRHDDRRSGGLTRPDGTALCSSPSPS